MLQSSWKTSHFSLFFPINFFSYFYSIFPFFSFFYPFYPFSSSFLPLAGEYRTINIPFYKGSLDFPDLAFSSSFLFKECTRTSIFSSLIWTDQWYYPNPFSRQLYLLHYCYVTLRKNLCPNEKKLIEKLSFGSRSRKNLEFSAA